MYTPNTVQVNCYITFKDGFHLLHTERNGYIPFIASIGLRMLFMLCLHSNSIMDFPKFLGEVVKNYILPISLSETLDIVVELYSRIHDIEVKSRYNTVDTTTSCSSAALTIVLCIDECQEMNTMRRSIVPQSTAAKVRKTFSYY